MSGVHLKYALVLEEEGELKQAEAQFIQEGKKKEGGPVYDLVSG